MATFDQFKQMYAEDPAKAMAYASYMGGAKNPNVYGAGGWLQENQLAVRDFINQQNGGDPNAYNRWVNENQSGGTGYQNMQGYINQFGNQWRNSGAATNANYNPTSPLDTLDRGAGRAQINQAFKSTGADPYKVIGMGAPKPVTSMGGAGYGQGSGMGYGTNPQQGVMYPSGQSGRTFGPGGGMGYRNPPMWASQMGRGGMNSSDGWADSDMGLTPDYNPNPGGFMNKAQYGDVWRGNNDPYTNGPQSKPMFRPGSGNPGMGWMGKGTGAGSAPPGMYWAGDPGTTGLWNPKDPTAGQFGGWQPISSKPPQGGGPTGPGIVSVGPGSKPMYGGGYGGGYSGWGTMPGTGTSPDNRGTPGYTVQGGPGNLGYRSGGGMNSASAQANSPVNQYLNRYKPMVPAYR